MSSPNKTPHLSVSTGNVVLPFDLPDLFADEADALPRRKFALDPGQAVNWLHR
ncbi:hypothetical protein MBAV_002883 [Candidatus Magnetobacterium bavaricum]|uniref:Uncharacterized protein n=1 Tax=Candidatus Magnetobacterium bavaricum TaxID=29290 RepID=A0A0F3GSG7_9BACT|nr:hypothetical protein MBAV_002883 [Candidatus Magnetobacterium bavaricum]